MSDQALFILECFASALGLLFIILLIKENIWCWFFGILSSAGNVVLMYQSQLYSESVLYVFYIFIGFYGWYKWQDTSEDKLVITKARPYQHVIIVAIGLILGLSLGTFEKNHLANSFRPFADAFSTIFSVLATVMEAQKWLSAWLYWIVINAFSVWLYYDRGIKVESLLMVVYFLLSIWGYIQWKHNYDKQLAPQPV